MNKNLFLAAVLCTGSMAAAQSDTASLNEVVVTANRFPQKQSNTGKVVSVITAQQLQRSGGKDLSQVLSEQSGITFNGANANPGKDKTLFLRGASSIYTLILLDGVPVNDPSGVGGSFDVRLIPIDQVERIEILKGSQSTLYGSNAIAGVVNIITKKATAQALTGNGLLAYGSYNTLRAAANISRKAKALEYNIGYEHFSTNGITEAKDTTGKAGFDRDGFDRQSFNATLGINITEQIKLSPFYRFSEYKGRYDADAFTDGNARFTASLVNTGLQGVYNYTGGAVYVNYGHSYTKRDFNGFPFAGTFNQAEAYISQRLLQNLQLLAGLNYQTMRMPTPDTANAIFSAYSSLYITSGKGLNVELGGRYNRHNQYGDNFTYSFNPSYLIDDKVKAFANISSGFRAPGINELFGRFGANPSLRPERSRSIEGGVQTWMANRKLSLLATYFNRAIKDVIVYGAAGYQNRDRQHDKGIELELQYQPDAKWNFRANYTFIDGEITQKLASKDTSFYNLLRRPKHTANLYAGFQASKQLFISAGLQHLGKRDDVYYDPATFIPQTKELKAYTLLNLYAAYTAVPQRLTIFADARNLTNKKDYTEVYGYNVQGFTLQGGLRFTL